MPEGKIFPLLDRPTLLNNDPDPDLFHVTAENNLTKILEHGLKSHYPSSEERLRLEEFKSRKGIDHLDEEALEEYRQEIAMAESTPEEKARHKLNELLPRHYDHIFFWTDGYRARGIESTMERRSSSEFVVLGVDSSKLPKTAYVGNYELSTDIFMELKDSYSDFAPTDPDRMDRVYDMVDEYEESLEVYNGQQGYELEVMYPDDIPPEAIATVDGERV